MYLLGVITSMQIGHICFCLLWFISTLVWKKTHTYKRLSGSSTHKHTLTSWSWCAIKCIGACHLGMNTGLFVWVGDARQSHKERILHVARPWRNWSAFPESCKEVKASNLENHGVVNPSQRNVILTVETCTASKHASLSTHSIEEICVYSQNPETVVESTYLFPDKKKSSHCFMGNKLKSQNLRICLKYGAQIYYKTRLKHGTCVSRE